MKFILNAFVTKSDLEYDNSEELWAGWQQGQWLQQLSKQISGVIMLLLLPMQSDWSPAENVLMRRGCLVLLSSQNNYGSYSRELQLAAPWISKQGSMVQASESAIIPDPWLTTYIGISCCILLVSSQSLHMKAPYCCYASSRAPHLSF